MAGIGTANLKRDLRRHHSRAGEPERQGGRMEAEPEEREAVDKLTRR